MAVTRWWDRAVADDPVPVMVARGIGGHRAMARLRGDAGVRLVTSPRHATVLIVVGAVPTSHLGALAAVHDQVPDPRAVATLGLTGPVADLGLGDDVPSLPVDDPGAAVHALHDDVLAGRVGRPPIGRADNPVDWQGAGPHGQGGEGMMGGTPYGRMMPMPPTEGRDGLALDRLALRLGPFLPGLPAGLVLDIGLQGDVLEEVALHPADARADVVGGRGSAVGDERVTALLVALAELCAVAGLGALARRAARVALDPDAAGVADLRRRLDRPWGLRAATDGVGRLPDGTDATDRFRGWLDEVADRLAGRRIVDDHEAVSSETAAEALVGAELGRAWVTLSSLRPDLEPDLRLPAAAGPT